MKIEKVLEEKDYAIYTIELEPGFYVDVKAFRTGSKLIYVMQNEDGKAVYECGTEVAAPTCFYSEALEKTIIDLVAMKEQEAAVNTTECPFCKHLADEKAREEHWENGPRYAPGYREEYTAACVSTTYYNGEVCGRLTSGGYALNFCPVCGKQLATGAETAPLTVDELRKIHGEPIYIKPFGWKICYGVESADIHNGVEKLCLGMGNYLNVADYGVKWVPYRQNVDKEK